MNESINTSSNKGLSQRLNDNAFNNNECYRTAADVKAYFSISNSTLWSWIASGLFPKPVKVGPRAVRFRAEDLRRFEAGLETANNNGTTGGCANDAL